MSNCECFSGTAGDKTYQPLGAVNKFEGFDVYQTKARDVSKSKAEILFLPDAFGFAKHNIILADRLAAQGYNVSIIDYYRGNAIPEIFLDYTPGTDLDKYDQFTEKEKDIIRGIDVGRWAQKNDPGQVIKEVAPFVEKFKQSLPPTSKLHIVGYCYGGIQAFHLAKAEHITSAVIMHPGPADLSDVKGFRIPLFIGLAENDVFVPNAPQDISKAMTSSGVYYKICVYGGTQHGFASRADPQNALAAKAYTSSIKDTVDWIAQF